MTIKEFYEWAVKHDAENEHLTLDVLSHYTGYATGLDEKMIVIDSGKNKKPNGVRIIVQVILEVKKV